jgi:hypothetical protein
MLPSFAAINAIEAASFTNLLRVWCRSDMTPVAPLPGLIGRARRRPFMAPRDPNKLLARSRVNVEVRFGRRPHPNKLPCTDCGHIWSKGERRHEYDHHKGYAAEHHFDVEPVCTICHAARDGVRANQTSCIHGLNWLICGGESGPEHRPMDSEWAMLIKNDCCRLEIPFFMKQMAGLKPIPDHLMRREFPNPLRVQQHN